MRAKKSTQARVNLGSSLVYRQQSPSGGYCKAWYLKISMRGQSPWIKATEHLLCSACLDFPRDQKLSAARGNCACKKPALEQAANVLAAETAAILERRKSPHEEAVESRGALTWGEVEPVWLTNGPVASRKAVWGKARLMVEQLTGKAMGSQALAEWTWSDCLNWAHLRQVYAARFGDEEVEAGSEDLPEALRKRVSRDVRRKLEAGRWMALRAELKGGKLGAPLVTSQVLKVNTTIKSYFGAMRNIIGSYSRQVHLRTLALPPMTDVLEGEISLPSPKGHAEIPEAAYAQMYEAVSTLKDEDEQMWLVGQMLWRFGLRPIEVWMARSDWLEETNGVSVLVIKNRQDGYVYESGARKGLTAELKARHRSIERRYRVPADVLDVMLKLMIPGGSLLGCPTTAAAQKLVEREHSGWIRLWLPDEEETHTNYLLRHFVGRYTQARWGDLASSLFLGHATTGVKQSVTASRYAGGGGTSVLPAIEWADLAPDAKYVRRMRGEFKDALFVDA